MTTMVRYTVETLQGKPREIFNEPLVLLGVNLGRVQKGSKSTANVPKDHRSSCGINTCPLGKYQNLGHSLRNSYESDICEPWPLLVQNIKGSKP